MIVQSELVTHTDGLLVLMLAFTLCMGASRSVSSAEMHMLFLPPSKTILIYQVQVQLLFKGIVKWNSDWLISNYTQNIPIINQDTSGQGTMCLTL